MLLALKNWWARQRRRTRLSIVKLRRVERASELRLQADPLPETGDRERETSAFWFRRITTTVLLGNGAGIVALGSYVADGKLSAEVAKIAYPAISSFLSGAILGFGCYFLSYLSTSLRFEAYTTILERAANIAKNEGKKSVSTQHDAAFYSILLIVFAQVAFLLFSAVNFYSGSSYILSALGQAACAEDRETYCYGSPILFPFVNPYDYEAAAKPAAPPSISSSEIRVEGISEGSGLETEVARLSVHLPLGNIVSHITPVTNIQLTSFYGLSCRFRMNWYSLGGPTPSRTREATALREALAQRRYAITPVSTRLYVTYRAPSGTISNEIVDVDLTTGIPEKVTGVDDPKIELMPFMFNGSIGYAIDSQDLNDQPGARCLELAKRAGFGLSERGDRLVSEYVRSISARMPD